MRRRLPQLCCYQAHATFSLCQTKAPLDLYPFAFVQIGLPFVCIRLLPRSAKRRAGKSDSVLLAVGQIVPVAIDLVCEDSRRIVSLAFAETFRNRL